MRNKSSDSGCGVIVTLKDVLRLQVRIWARRKAIEAQQGSYALNVTGSILQFYEKYYNAKYPLPKSGRSAVLVVLRSQRKQPQDNLSLNCVPPRSDRPA